MQGFDFIIVESPNKAKTIAGYLKESPREWVVKATLGGIQNLPKNEMGVAVHDREITCKWVYEKGKQKLISEIASLARRANMVYIATDDDREGEKIAQDVIEKAKITKFKRVVFTEISKEAVLNNLNEHVRSLDYHTSKAAKARRISDRIIGYPLSQIIKYSFKQNLSPHIPKGLGRVTSPALHIIVERETQIDSFTVEEYKRISIDYVYNGIHFRCHNPLQFKREDEDEMNKMLLVIKTSPHIVSNYKRKTDDQGPKKPLITSTLQYGAWYLYGMKPKKVMKIAQKLFESGLITYHRTDSYKISELAHLKIVELLYVTFGEEYVKSEQREYKNKPTAQAGHEAIRPIVFEKEYFPKELKKRDVLTGDEFLIYEFIWYRTLSTQLKDAIYDASLIEIDIGGNKFSAQANHLIFDGWERLMGNLIKISDRDEDEDWKDMDIQLPEVPIGKSLKYMDISLSDHKTKRPHRYGVGRFITTLDNLGIARPSTLDGIIENLEDVKEYIQIHKGMLYPTELGTAVDLWVSDNCPWLNDAKHALEFEQKLDVISSSGDNSADDLVREYESLMNEVADKVGFSHEKYNATSFEQKKMIDQIATEKGIEVGEDIYKNKDKAIIFLRNHLPVKTHLFKCPECKEGKVVEGEKNYYCSEYKAGCKFTLWKNRIDQFFQSFNITEDHDNILKKSKSAPVVFEKLITSKGNTVKNVAIVLKKDDEFGWGLGLKFKKGTDRKS